MRDRFWEKFLVFLLIFLILPATAVLAEEEKLACQNNSFTTFGVGIESITYQEKTLLRGGIPVETETTLTNIVQRSAGYTSVSPKIGFFLETASSLDNGTDQEGWEIAGGTIIQTNEMKIKTSELNLLGAYHLRPGHMFTAGLDVFSLNFSRSDVHTSSKVQNAALGAVSEDSFSFIGVLGYRYDSVFARPEAPLRFRCGVKASVPVYYKVYNSGSAELERQLDASDNYLYQPEHEPIRDNTGEIISYQHIDANGYLINESEEDHYVTNIVQSDPITLENVFGGGYGVGADIGLGWRLNPNFTLQFALEALYKSRDEIKEDGFTLPEVTVTVVRGLAGLIWSF